MDTSDKHSSLLRHIINDKLKSFIVFFLTSFANIRLGSICILTTNALACFAIKLAMKKFYGVFFASFANIRLGSIRTLMTNALAYFAVKLAMKKL